MRDLQFGINLTTEIVINASDLPLRIRYEDSLKLLWLFFDDWLSLGLHILPFLLYWTINRQRLLALLLHSVVGKRFCLGIVYSFLRMELLFLSLFKSCACLII